MDLRSLTGYKRHTARAQAYAKKKKNFFVHTFLSSVSFVYICCFVFWIFGFLYILNDTKAAYIESVYALCWVNVSLWQVRGCA